MGGATNPLQLSAFVSGQTISERESIPRNQSNLIDNPESRPP